MHRTRFGSVVIDCDDFEAGIAFWAAALGVDPDGLPRDDHYASLGHVASGLRLLIQKVPEPKSSKSRVHLDIETDDIEAEVARMEALGATRAIRQSDGGWVMFDVCGNEFYVIPPETPGFPEDTISWD